MTERGVILAAFGRQYEVRTEAGDVLLCYPRAKRSLYACGDEVAVGRTGEGQGVLEKLLPRRSLLHRADAFREKLIAANVTQVVIVVATEPSFSDELISRCLCAAEAQDLQSLIVLNKADLAGRLAPARRMLLPFRDLGHPIIELSAEQDVAPLHPHLAGHTSILVGQSGMGKSTLINALIPGTGAATREISTSLDSGKHTTTFARLYPLEGAAWLIDSPGLQAFGLAHLSAADLEHGFRELRPYHGQCRFRDCRHTGEPGCAVQAAVSAGTLNPRRLALFLQIREEVELCQRQARGH
ncbi:MAG: ribosome small subunit-dependent GTPase A [Rhodocyclaceae bacterium]|jgi:ribosome biogenesis GTPase|nr:ribosome small subunit-dependent GTPase A [Rhodocyclaceae bacterium]